MEEKYEKLLEQTVVYQGELTNAVKSLQENTKLLNDNFVLHCGITKDTNNKVTILYEKVLKYLVWSILGIIILLGGERVIELLTKYVT